MPRTFLLIAAVLAFTPLACRLPPEREPLRPLPEDAAFTYTEMINRARVQFSIALDAFYLDSWKELEEAAQGLEQTARFLPKTSEPPPHLKEDVILKSKDMRNEALKLAEGARTKSIDRCSDALKNLNLQIRALRPVEPPASK